MKGGDKPDHKADHAASNQDSYDAARASLTLLATQMYGHADEIKAGLKATDAPVQNEFFDGLAKKYEHINSAASHSSIVLKAYNLDDQHQGMLSKEVAQVIHAFDVWQKQMVDANDAAVKRGYSFKNPEFVKQAIDTYAEKMGLKTKEVLASNGTRPTESVDSAMQTALHEHMQGAISAVNSTKSDGSTTDSTRALKHAQEVLWIARSNPGTLHKKDKLFTQMKTAIRGMEATHPGMKADLESTLSDLDGAAK